MDQTVHSEALGADTACVVPRHGRRPFRRQLPPCRACGSIGCKQPRSCLRGSREHAPRVHLDGVPWAVTLLLLSKGERMGGHFGVLQDVVGVLVQGGGAAPAVRIGLDPADVLAAPEAPLLQAVPPRVQSLRTAAPAPPAPVGLTNRQPARHEDAPPPTPGTSRGGRVMQRTGEAGGEGMGRNRCAQVRLPPTTHDLLHSSMRRKGRQFVF